MGVPYDPRSAQSRLDAGRFLSTIPGNPIYDRMNGPIVSRPKPISVSRPVQPSNTTECCESAATRWKQEAKFCSELAEKQEAAGANQVATALRSASAAAWDASKAAREGRLADEWRAAAVHAHSTAEEWRLHGEASKAAAWRQEEQRRLAQSQASGLKSHASSGRA